MALSDREKHILRSLLDGTHPVLGLYKPLKPLTLDVGGEATAKIRDVNVLYTYLSEVERGIVHTSEWDQQMRELQFKLYHNDGKPKRRQTK